MKRGKISAESIISLPFLPARIQKGGSVSANAPSCMQLFRATPGDGRTAKQSAWTDPCADTSASPCRSAAWRAPPSEKMGLFYICFSHLVNSINGI